MKIQTNKTVGAIPTILDLNGTKEKPNSYFIGGTYVIKRK